MWAVAVLAIAAQENDRFPLDRKVARGNSPRVGASSTCEVCRHGNRVFLIVDGDFLDEVAIPAADRFSELIDLDDAPIEFVCLVKHMGKYGTPGRQAWQRALASTKHRLTQVTVECDSGLVRMAASAICLYAGIKIKFIDHPHEFSDMLPRTEAHRAS